MIADIGKVNSSEFWNTHPLRYTNMILRHRNLWLYLKDRIQQEEVTRAIEVGCGPMSPLKALVNDYTGIDINERCKGVLHDDFLTMDVEQLPDADLLVAFNVIEHVADPVAFIKQAMKCPVPWIIISFFDVNGLRRHKDYLQITQLGYYKNKYSKRMFNSMLKGYHVTWKRIDKATMLMEVDK